MDWAVRLNPKKMLFLLSHRMIDVWLLKNRSLRNALRQWTPAKRSRVQIRPLLRSAVVHQMVMYEQNRYVRFSSKCVEHQPDARLGIFTSRMNANEKNTAVIMRTKTENYPNKAEISEKLHNSRTHDNHATDNGQCTQMLEQKLISNRLPHTVRRAILYGLSYFVRVPFMMRFTVFRINIIRRPLLFGIRELRDEMEGRRAQLMHTR